MTPEQIFSFCSTLVLPGWLLLIILPRKKATEYIITGIIVIILALVYAYLIFKNLKPADMNSFGTLSGVSKLFTNPEALLAGWIHYLAFDLMIGLFEVKNAQKHNIHHLLVIPCLFFTFMLGPVGLLLYFIIRMVKTKKYFVSTFQD